MHVSEGQTPGPLPVSVVIPAYNRAQLIACAVASAQRQRPAPPAQILVVDDCSADETGDVARALGATVIRHDVNRGRGAARNSGIDAAQHDWVAFLDSDDEWLPGHLHRLWSRRAGHVAVAASAVMTGDGPPQLLGLPSASSVEITRHRELLVPQNPVPLSASIADRRSLRALHGFREGPTAEDLDMWVRMLGRGTILLCPEPGVLYHVHDGQVSGDPGRMRGELFTMLDDHREEPWCTEALVESIEVTARWGALREAQWAGDRATMRRCARWLLDRPGRIRDLVALWVWRRRVQRRLARVDPQVAGELAAAGVEVS